MEGGDWERQCNRQKHRAAPEGKFLSGDAASYPKLSPYWSEKKRKVEANLFAIKQKVPDFARNQELFGKATGLRASDPLRVKIRLDGKRHAFESFPILFDAVCWRLRIHPGLTAPLFPPRFFLLWVTQINIV